VKEFSCVTSGADIDVEPPCFPGIFGIRESRKRARSPSGTATRPANPIRQKLYIPGYRTDANQREVLGELAEAKSAAVVVWKRPAGESGRGSSVGLRRRPWAEHVPDFRGDAPEDSLFARMAHALVGHALICDFVEAPAGLQLVAV
jgi:hypothetical protein